MLGNSWVAERQAASQEELSSMELETRRNENEKIIAFMTLLS
jgi:hypothetical protein